MTIKKDKRLLIVAYIYPPIGGSGVQRALKFTRYLPESGWGSYVVCGNEDFFGDGLDPSLVPEIPAQVRVWRRSFVNPLRMRHWLQKRLRMGRSAASNLLTSSRRTAEDVGIKKSSSRPSSSHRRSQSFLTAVSGVVAPFEFPAIDSAIYWSLAILPGCIKLIRREQIDAIFTTSFPYSDHVTGYLLKKLTGIPWVADFRDPWSLNESARNHGWRYRVDQWVEKIILHNADRVVGVTPTYTADMRRLAPTRASQCFVTIENGYDAADFPTPPPGSTGLEPSSLEPQVQPDQPVRLAHIGFLYAGTAIPFLQAVHELGPIAARLHLSFTGGLSANESAWLEQHPLAAPMIVQPRVSHAQAIQRMRQSDWLLLFALGGSQRSGHYPGKLFEYMASGVPILMIGPPGDAAELVQRSGTGIHFASDDQAGLTSALLALAESPQGFRQEFYHPQPGVIQAYERRALTEKLANLLDEITESRPL